MVMSFWKRSKRREQASQPADIGQVQPARKGGRRSSPVAMEVKLLAIEALESGAEKLDVAAVIGVGPSTLAKWHKQYTDSGVAGLCRRASSISVRKQCTELEKKILAHRREHPEHGVRRIRDELRRDEGLAVSAEKVRTVVNAAGLGNPPPVPHRRPPGTRRFERSLPNAMWQIDIFTFQLKRLYRVYLIGILDDHSRFVVGWGLYRQQTAEAVLEVLKGAIGQWGAPREILSDNGRQFVAWRGETRFQRVLKQQGIQHVRSAPHHPMTLGKIERFWQTLWREYLSEAVFASFADACRRIDHWIQYYNHQRPHQGIDGACPADRFYGMEGDVEEAVRQGCQENALRLALGQEPQAPLYLLGQLGGTDVRVVRKGEDIEVKVGEAVREVIRLGAPYEIGEDGCGRREEVPEVDESQRRGTLPGGGAGSQGGGGDHRALPDVRREPSDALPCSGGGGQSFGGGFDTEASWSQAPAGLGAEACGGRDEEGEAGEGAYPDAPEVRGGAGAPGSSAEGGAWGEAPGREKNSPAGPAPGSEPPFIDWDEDRAGRWR
jgi:transposase InsO family protein